MPVVLLVDIPPVLWWADDGSVAKFIDCDGCGLCETQGNSVQ
jgi:hypothetical protein